jgi:hypothetical protein
MKQKYMQEQVKRLCANIRKIFCRINQNTAPSSLLMPLKFLFVLSSIFSSKLVVKFKVDIDGEQPKGTVGGNTF